MKQLYTIYLVSGKRNFGFRVLILYKKNRYARFIDLFQTLKREDMTSDHLAYLHNENIIITET